MKIRMSSTISYDSIVDGPGLRMVIWTQGCIHNCKECHNPQTHDLCGGFYMDTEEIINKVKSLKLQKGITLSGGEPFLQPEPLEVIAREAKTNGLDVWSYTGFTFEQLLDKRNSAYFKNLNLLKQIDILVDGKFVAEKKDISLKFRGSSNQRIIDVQKSLKYKKVFLVEQYMKDDLSIAE
ncbi:anaerobic ribonucleoside-triphosphate reductase activating protein [Clostridioides difficile]|uniref:Anaerobic ribonucleoside-triphosphate reductase-activating protein n=2 Tax=Clostridioides difficile TaxID=1496 RepID=A0AAX3H4W1_CLODI|nr:anaerobic ribonucleoside-triphosphate reductase activating protein [Clostridioides difficile]AVD36506.1 anaerobic ribonucleoside-triphosphate reductase activating protein [Clostridioides difficile]AVD40044.1 anaerobic ribonucleoside-triphosphate reductase activating protein [Clostridioides difficile]AVD43557.1 anaerobic ribonucleoside-triphosphate reductase activating protein [Clostridioides difficile]AXU66581.1 anaerobic ribonucleoside-triphosphate reductase activating protein [Clostridioid